METTNRAKLTGHRRRNTNLNRLAKLLEMGNIDEFRRAMKRSSVDRLQPAELLNTTDVEVTLALLEGRFGDARRMVNESSLVAGTLPIEPSQSSHGVQLFTLLRELGEFDALSNGYREFTSDRWSTATWRPAVSLLLVEIGRLDDAKSEFQQLSANDFSSIPRNGLWSTSLSYLAEVSMCVGNAHDASRLYTLLEPLDGYNIVASNAAVCYGPAARYLGLLATQLPRFDVAERHFRKALAMSSELQAQPYLAHTQHEYATMLLTRKAARDSELAHQLFLESRATAQRLGMRTLLARLQSEPLFENWT